MFWRFKENLAIREGVLKYKWMSGIDIQIKEEILRVNSFNRSMNCWKLVKL